MAYYQFNEDVTDPKVPDRIGPNHGSLYGAAERLLSTAPVGGGSSHRMTVNATGNHDFAQAGLSLDFNGSHPNGEVVVSRINLTPDEVPNAYPTSRSYWVVNNYGSNNSFGELNGIHFENIGFVSSADEATPDVFKLYKRASNADGNTWGTSLDDADIAQADVDGNVSFTAGNSVSSFSQFILTNEDGSSLPLELLSFTARHQEERNVLLEWVTESEINTDKFIIERSKNGVDFEEIGTVNAAGNSTEFLEYSFLDQDAFLGKSFYRLRIFDLDGSFTYSEIRTVFIGAGLSDVAVFPNPVRKGNGVNIILSANQSATFTLFDAKGRLLQENIIQEEFILQTQDLAKGAYMYRIKGSDRMFNGVLVVQ